MVSEAVIELATHAYNLSGQIVDEIIRDEFRQGIREIINSLNGSENI